MAVVLVEGFDLFNGTGVNTGLQSRWTTYSGTNYNLTTGRFGGQCFRASSSTNTGSVQKSFSASATVSFGFAYQCTTDVTATSLRPHVILLSAGTTMVGFRFEENGAIDAYRLTGTTAGTLLGSSADNVLALTTWHYLEFEVTISDTVGTIDVYVDGTSVLSLTGQDTRNGAPTTVNAIAIGNIGTSVAGMGIHLFDDLYVVNTLGRLGERRVETLYPAADTAQSDFTPLSGSDNYAMVDEATADGDTSYVQASTVGNLDLYTIGAMSSTPTDIDAVQISAFAIKTDAAARTINLTVKSGATTDDGSAKTLAGSYGISDRLLLTDPDTAAAWTSTGVNSLQIGPKVAS